MNVVIINGWAMPFGIWHEFCDSLKISPTYDHCRVIDIDRRLNLSEWIQYLDTIIKPDTLLIGWSLGGMFAVEYAHQHPEKIRGLCTLQMNPKFVAEPEWPTAMTQRVFQEFKQLIESGKEADAKKMVKRFGFLVSTKGIDALADLKKLKTHFSVSSIPSSDTLSQSLELLDTLDVRNKLAMIVSPQLHIYGEHDQLIPMTAAKQVKALSDRAHIEVIDGVSHLPCYSATSLLIKRINEFVGGFN